MARDYVADLEALLPTGGAWPRGEDTVYHQLNAGLAAEFARIDQRAADLLEEMDPRTTTELLPDWERVAGLPDPCTAAPTTLEGRRAALTARLISRGGWSGGPSVPFLTVLIEALGYDTPVIRRFHRQPFTCESACNDSLNTDSAGWMFVWEFITRHGELDEVLMCQVERYALAHLGLTFAFPLFFFADGTFTRTGTAVFSDPQTGNQSALASGELGTLYLGV